MARVLVVEDDPHVRLLLRRLLEQAGHEVAEAGDGDEALSHYRQSLEDVVVMDLVLPCKEGLETIRCLKREFPEAKIIAISGGGRTRQPTSYLKLAEQFGAARSLPKPFGAAELLDAVGDVLAEGKK